MMQFFSNQQQLGFEQHVGHVPDIHLDSKLLAPVVCFAELDFGLFEQNKIHLISIQTIQEGIEHTKAEDKLRSV